MSVLVLTASDYNQSTMMPKYAPIILFLVLFALVSRANLWRRHPCHVLWSATETGSTSEPKDFAEFMRLQFQFAEGNIPSNDAGTRNLGLRLQQIFVENMISGLHGTTRLMLEQIFQSRSTPNARERADREHESLRAWLGEIPDVWSEDSFENSKPFFLRMAPYIQFNPTPARTERHFTLNETAWRQFLIERIDSQ